MLLSKQTLVGVLYINSYYNELAQSPYPFGNIGACWRKGCWGTLLYSQTRNPVRNDAHIYSGVSQTWQNSIKPQPLGSKDSKFKAFGLKGHTIAGFWAILSLRVIELLPLGAASEASSACAQCPPARANPQGLMHLEASRFIGLTWALENPPF